MVMVHEVLERTADNIENRSKPTRDRYLELTKAEQSDSVAREKHKCGRCAHASGTLPPDDRKKYSDDVTTNIGIISAAAEMLTAHMPFYEYPDIIKDEARKHAAIAQIAGHVPSMCDGVTQGTDGMEISLFSRDVIARSAAVAASHDMFEALVYLTTCDKITPGELIAALQFADKPSIFMTGGPMESSEISHVEKDAARVEFRIGNMTRADLLNNVENKIYAGKGTCGFHGTANTNVMMMIFMGLLLAGADFTQPNDPLKEAQIREAIRRIAAGEVPPLYEIFDAKAIVNGIVAVMATGGSTNHTIHIPAIAAAAGYKVTWDDFDAISKVVPLIAKIYPNGPADINFFHQAGGTPLLISELLNAGLLHNDVTTVCGKGLDLYTKTPELYGADGKVVWKAAPKESLNPEILTTVDKPFEPNGGIVVLHGNLGDAVSKISAVKPEHRYIKAVAKVFNSQAEIQRAFDKGDLRGDFVAVVRGTGPGAIGMPELHQIMTPLKACQKNGQRVAVVTDGRFSGATGAILAAMHVSPEAEKGGPIAKIRDGDMIIIDGNSGELSAHVDYEEWEGRTPTPVEPAENEFRMGRSLFAPYRAAVNTAEEGAHTFGDFGLGPKKEGAATPSPTDAVNP